MRMLAIVVALFLLSAAATSQRVIFPYSGSTVSVVVDSSIWAGAGAGNTNSSDDYPAGLMVYGISNEQDGTKSIVRVVSGTNYSKRNPDTVAFISATGVNSVSVWAMHDTLGDKWKGVYNVTVGGVKHKIDTSNLVYLYELRTRQQRATYSGSSVRVVVDSSIWAGTGAGNTSSDDDYPCGLFVYGVAKEQDGTRPFVKVFEGTHYYKRKPDTLDFTAPVGIQSISLWAMHGAPGDNWKGVYNVKVNGVSHKVGMSNIVYLTDKEVPVQHASVGPAPFTLDQNYPNPFNPSTRIGFSLPERSHVLLSVFNILGQQVAVLVDRKVEAGFHAVSFDGSTIPSGVYFYRLQAGGAVQMRKLTLVK